MTLGSCPRRARARRPWTLRSQACELARLHADIAATAAPSSLRHVMDDLPSALAVDAVPRELAERARQVAERLEDGTNLLHGDLHPGNVRMDPKGPWGGHR
jgi:Ser/Thr protein kinase RdoA (MazF antagonist)